MCVSIIEREEERGRKRKKDVLHWTFGCFDATTSGKLDKVANAAKVLDIRLASSLSANN